MPTRSSTGPLLSLAAGLALVAASLLGFWWLGRGASLQPAVANSPAIQGKPAPDFVLPDINGKTVRLSDLRGQVVLINLWATWCPPCRAEMPDLAAIYNEYKAQGFVILGVDDQEHKETILDFLTRNPLPYSILLDPDSRVARAYGTSYLPASFLVDRRGVLRASYPGQANRAKLETTLEPLLAEKP